MRTSGGEVVRGRWGRSATGRSPTELFTANDVAVLVCWMTVGLGIVGLAESRGLRTVQAQFTRDRSAAQSGGAGARRAALGNPVAGLGQDGADPPSGVGVRPRTSTCPRASRRT